MSYEFREGDAEAIVKHFRDGEMYFRFDNVFDCSSKLSCTRCHFSQRCIAPGSEEEIKEVLDYIRENAPELVL